jgi:hypothetical protein
MTWRLHQIWLGINMFSWRCRWWFGGYFATGCRLKIIWWGGTLFTPTQVFAWLAVGGGDCASFVPLIRFWVGISSADPFLLHDLSFNFFIKETVPEHAVFSCIYFGYVLFWWFGMNEITDFFKAKKSSIIQMLENVKVHSLWWMKAYDVNLGLNTHMWWSSLLVCLDID